MDALVVSRHPIALLISSCSWSIMSERVLRSIPGWVPACGVAGTLVTLGVSDTRVRECEWLIGVASLGLAACGDACWDVATGLGMAKTGLSGLSKFSALMVNGAIWTTDIGLLGVLSPEAGLEVSSTIWDKSSWSLAAMLLQLAASLGHSTAKHVEKGSVEALQGPGRRGILSPSIAHGRSSWSGKDSWTGPLRVFISQMGGCGMESCTGSSPPFKPCGSHIAGAFTPAICVDVHRYPCLALHQSWHWYDPCWIGVHVGCPH